jgi:hypothetical protein
MFDLCGKSVLFQLEMWVFSFVGLRKLYIPFSFAFTKLVMPYVEALRVIVDAPWFVPNTVIRRDAQTPTAKKKNTPLQLPIQSSPQRTPK